MASRGVVPIECGGSARVELGADQVPALREVGTVGRLKG